MENMELVKGKEIVKEIWKILNNKQDLQKIIQNIKIDYLNEKYKKRFLKEIIRNTKLIIKDLKKDFYIKNWNDLFNSIYEFLKYELEDSIGYYIEDETFPIYSESSLKKFVCENDLELMNITLNWKKDFFKDLKEIDYQTIIVEMEYKAWIDLIDSFITSLKNYIENKNL